MTRSATQIYRSINEVPGQIWDAAAQGELGFDRRLLMAMESGDGNTSRYIVSEGPDGSATVATAMEFRDPNSSNPFTDLFLGRADHGLPVLRRFLGPVLILRTRFAHTCGITPRSGGDGDADDRLHRFFEDLECFADTEGLAIVALNVSNTDDVLTRVFASRGYADSIGRPVAQLHINWSSWDGYLRTAKHASLNAVSSIRKEVTRARKGGLVVSEWDSSITSEYSLRRIYDSHHRRMNDQALSYPVNFFSNLKERVGDDIRVLVAHRDTELVGSTFLLVSKDRAVLPLVGIDHALDGGTFAYFNLTYYAPIRIATKLGLKVVSFGPGAYAAKIRRGCRCELNRLFWRPSSRTGRRVCRYIAAAHASVFRRKFGRELAAKEFSTLGS